MLISHTHKFISIDIPKTGTRSLRETLQSICKLDIIGTSYGYNFHQHGTATQCAMQLKRINHNFDDYYSFCLVRNPWERYLSFYKYYKQKADEYQKIGHKIWPQQDKHQGEYCVNLFSLDTPQAILKEIISVNKPQSDYYLNKQGAIMVKHIGQFENLQQELNNIFKTVGVKQVPIKHSNKSTISLRCGDIYDRELVDMVIGKEFHVIELKSYKYNKGNH